MRSIWKLASLSVLGALLFSSACSQSKDDDEGAAGGGTGGSGDKAGSSTGANGSDAGAPQTGGVGAGGSASSGGEPPSAAGDDGAGGGGEPASNVSPIESCSTGSLLAGDPLFTDDLEGQDPKGQGLLDDPPIRNEALAVIGSKVFIETEFELWSFDMADAAPQLVRFAGAEPSAYVNAGVPCKDTRFLVVRDMTATADGKLVVVDYVGGAIIEITDPAGPNCTSHWVAGTHEKTDDPGSD